MKRIVLIAGLMAGYLMPTFAQRSIVEYNQSLPKDSTLYQRSVPSKLSATNSLPYGVSLPKSNDAVSKKLLPLTALKGKNLNLAFNRPSEMEKMPCVKPTQKYRMPVSKPDSTVKRTLLIKKF